MGVSMTEDRLCRVTVHTPTTDIDLSLPSTVPVALLIGAIVDLLARQRPTNFPPSPSSGWQLARLGVGPLPGERTLRELGIVDGDQILLLDGETWFPEPLFDDIADGVLGATPPASWTRNSARTTGAIFAFLTALLSAAALLELGMFHRMLALAAGIGVSAASVLAQHVWRDRLAAKTLAHSAMCYAAVAGVLTVAGQPSVSHLMPGFAAVFVAAALTTSGWIFSSVIALGAMSLMGCFGCVLVGVLDIGPSRAGAICCLLSLLMLTVAPRISLLAGGLPRPVIGKQGVKSWRTSDLNDRVTRTHTMLTGLTWGMSLTAGAGAAMALLTLLEPDTSFPHRCSGPIFASVASGALLLRMRTHPYLDRAAGCITGALLAPVAALLYVFAAGSNPLIVSVVGGVAAVSGLALGFAGSAHEFSPVARRLVELIEYALLCSLVPAGCWVCGIFTLTRELSLT